jgi:serine/threonine protein kinase
VTSPYDRLTTALADRYAIERELGQGGMATVYLAQDLKHDRKVALKVLKPELAAVLGADRFVVEIKTTASLSHPHILPLFDSGEADGFLFYVMPFIDGETLRDTLNRETQLGIDQAVRVAREVADALDYAHRNGVIHRDIKPENILMAEGRPMVADFGIALALSAAAGGRMTETGLSLGTPHYMSPEQATAEKEISARSDVYSLGSVLYEMLAGEPPHIGGSAQQIIMKIIAEQAQPLTALRKSVPANVAAAVAKSLEKLPADRFESAAAFSAALADPGFTTANITGVGGTTAGQGVPRSALFAAAGLGAVLFGAALWGWLRPTPESPPSRFALEFPTGQRLDAGITGTSMTISRDGGTLAYVGTDSAGVSRLWVKRREELEAAPIPGTEEAYGPFLSPDAREVGFFREGGRRSMYLVTIAGGMPRLLYDGLLGTSGGDWATDGYIYFDTDAEGLQRIRPDGSGREPVLTLDQGRDEIGFAWPQVLPGDRTIITRLRRASDAPGDFDIVAGRIGTGEHTAIVRGVGAVFHAGHLFYAMADGTLLASRFDEDRLALSGTPVVLATGVQVAGTYAGVNLSISEGGTLYYVAGSSGLASTLAWVLPDGSLVPADSTWEIDARIDAFALAPDGRRVAVEFKEADRGDGDIWVKELPAGPMTPLVRNDRYDGEPSWSADGRWVYFTSWRDSSSVINRRRANGLGSDSLMMRGVGSLWYASESRDGQWLVAETVNRTTRSRDIVALSVGTDTVAMPLIATPAGEADPRISPDGRWLAYTSDVSGRREIYVRTFPNVDDGIWQVSIDGGRAPEWSSSGRTLYFITPGNDALLAAEVGGTTSFTRGMPRPVITPTRDDGISLTLGYAPDPDGPRILVARLTNASATSRLVRIDNVLADLARRGPQ